MVIANTMTTVLSSSVPRYRLVILVSRQAEPPIQRAIFAETESSRAEISPFEGEPHRRVNDGALPRLLVRENFCVLPHRPSLLAMRLRRHCCKRHCSDRICERSRSYCSR